METFISAQETIKKSYQDMQCEHNECVKRLKDQKVS
jgi:hypothetical protein